jgi:hypothetical protein
MFIGEWSFLYVITTVGVESQEKAASFLFFV